MRKILRNFSALGRTFSLAFVVLSCVSNNNPAEETSQKETIMVFAGASLTDVLNVIIDSFEVKYPAIVKTNIASSGTLARQIAQGANPDIYISANVNWADYVDSLGYFEEGFKKVIARNQLVLIAPAGSAIQVPAIDSSLNFRELLGAGRLSMGDPAHVPAGRYAQQALNYYGWYSGLENKVLPASNVRSALRVVEMQEAPIGIVYRTDALKSKKVSILNTFPEYTHESIVYVGGLCSKNELAKVFYNYLTAEESAASWEKFGFTQ